MTQRIKESDLKSQIDLINTILGKGPKDIGRYRMDCAYGGYRLVKITSDGGAIDVISRDGFGTKRQLKTFLDGMIATLNH